MIYGSVCSGIEAASVAWKPLGWRAAFVSEIEPFPRAVLKHHHPETPLHGDFTTIQAGDYEPIDLLVGGTPCQSFSVAGLRGGLGDERGNLALEYLRLADRLRPRWLAWENVPGVFSSTSHPAPDPRPPEIDLDGGNGPQDGEEVVVADEYDADESHALACFLAGLSELGYGFAYRVLDAQFTRTRKHPWAVPQRRRRLFVVGYLGDWRRAAAVLFDANSLSGNPAPSRKAGQSLTHPTAGSLTASGRGADRTGETRGQDPVIAVEAGLEVRRLRGDELSDVVPDVRMVRPGTHGGRRPSGPLAVAQGASVAGTLNANGKAAGSATQQDAEQGMLVPVAFGGNNTSGPIEVATAVNAHGGPHGRQDFESETFVAHALRGEGFDASEDGTGRGTPLVPVLGFSSKDHGQDAEAEVSPTLRAAGHDGSHANSGAAPAIAFAIQERAISENASAGPDGIGVRSDGAAYTLESRQVPQAVAFALRGREAGAQPEMEGDGETVGTLRAADGGSSRDYVAFDTTQITSAANYSNPQPGDPCHPLTANGDPPAMAFTVSEMANGFAWESEVNPTLNAHPQSDTSGLQYGVRVASAVRRLTPRECERLQGFPDDYTLVPWRGGVAADGPRYKALGNSMAVNVMTWIGERIALVDALDV